MPIQATCPACEGTGHRRCIKCGGTGRQEFNPWELPLRNRDCVYCHGSGRENTPDPACKGTGRIDLQQNNSR